LRRTISSIEKPPGGGGLTPVFFDTSAAHLEYPRVYEFRTGKNSESTVFPAAAVG
jgi:hypothetical protein